MHRPKVVTLSAVVLGIVASPAVVVAQDGCKLLAEAHKLPRLAVVLDSAALAANLPAPDAGAPAEVLVSVMTGGTPQVHVMDSVVAATSAGATVRERIRASLQPGARNAIPAFRVRVTLAQPVGVYVEPSVLCDPKPIGPQERRVGFTVIAPAGPGSAPRLRPVTPRIKIGVNGEVLQVDIGGGSGYPDADRAIRQAHESQRYQPARLDGRPVQVWLRDRRVELVR